MINSSGDGWVEQFKPVIEAIKQESYSRGWHDAMASMAKSSTTETPNAAPHASDAVEAVEVTESDDIQVMANPPPRPSRSPKEYRPVKDLIGESFTLTELLDSLHGHAKEFKLVRQSDPDAARIFETFGCAIVAQKRMTNVSRLEPYFLTAMPSLGCVYMPTTTRATDDDDLVCMSFGYFIKQRRPVNVQFTNGVVYQVGGVYNFNFKRHRGPIAATFFISVAPDGSIKMLKECSRSYQRPGFYRMQWQYRDIFVDAAARASKKRGHQVSIDDYATEVFAAIANPSLSIDEGLQVRTRMGRDVATFSIPMLSTPYFFADRQKMVNHNGRTKRIIHIVRGHQRADGQFVKSHFRGLRTFHWKGFSVSVGLRGLHGPMPTQFSAESWDEMEVKRLGLDPQQFVSTDEVGQRLARAW